MATEADAGPPLEREYRPTDGWRTADPADHGLDVGEVAEVERMLAEAYTTVRSVLLVRNGLLVYQRYGPGLDAEDGHDVRSVTRSVVSALVGVVLAGGEIESLDQTVGDLLADHLPPEADPRLAGATLRHLLSMTSGLPFDDPTLAGDPTIFDGINRHPDRIRATTSLPLAADPGTRWGYSNASSDLLAAAVVEATGRPCSTARANVCPARWASTRVARTNPSSSAGRPPLTR